MPDSKRTFKDVPLSGSSSFPGSTETGKPISLFNLPRTNNAAAEQQASVACSPSPRAAQKPAGETELLICRKNGYRSIRWAIKPWNVTTGCTRASTGCRHCYAPKMHARKHGVYLKYPDHKNSEKYSETFDVVKFHDSALDDPYGWKQSLLIFVNSMSDLFHGEMKLPDIQKTFEVMNECPQHTFILLTRRAERLLKFSFQLPWAPNIWAGVSVENDTYVNRVELLKETDAHVKWVNLEPLVGDVPSLNLDGIDWAVVGGESGVGQKPDVRPIKEEWVLKIQEQCAITGTPFFFTGCGGNIRNQDKLFRGKEYSAMPPCRAFQCSSPRPRTTNAQSHGITVPSSSSLVEPPLSLPLVR